MALRGRGAGFVAIPEMEKEGGRSVVWRRLAREPCKHPVALGPRRRGRKRASTHCGGRRQAQETSALHASSIQGHGVPVFATTEYVTPRVTDFCPCDAVIRS